MFSSNNKHTPNCIHQLQILADTAEKFEEVDKVYPRSRILIVFEQERQEVYEGRDSTLRFKVTDGERKYSELPYVNAETTALFDHIFFAGTNRSFDQPHSEYEDMLEMIKKEGE